VILSSSLHDRIADPRRCVLPVMLDERARQSPDAAFIDFDKGESWSYAKARELALQTAARLEQLGIGRHDRVAVWLPDGPDIIRISLAAIYLGAVFVPLGPSLTGTPLQNALGYLDPEILIAPKEYLDRLPAGYAHPAEHTVAIDCTREETLPGGQSVLPGSTLTPDGSVPSLLPTLKPWDTHTIYLTSGTTGVSKGVECSHIHTATMAIDGLRFLKPGDRFMSPSAYFHIAGSYVPWAALHYGAVMVVVGRFSTSQFWEQVRRNGVTITLLIGVMADFLLSRPASPDDRDTPLRLVIQQPLLPDVHEFCERFGVEVYTQFDQTETSPPVTTGLIAPGQVFGKGLCGKVRGGFDVRLVDENDCEVPDGVPGEMCLRCDVPWVIAPDYFRMPEATARAWRNGWFHTGDMFRKDDAGNYYFVDRSKHVIRRRGENISSFEVEQEALGHPVIKAAAAYAVPDGRGDCEVMLAVEPGENKKIDLADLAAHLETRLPKHMVPRFMRVLPNLPRSASDKVSKIELAETGVTPDTWDRQSEPTLAAD